MFVDKDDADRYYGLLVANDYERELEVMEVDEETVKFNCRGHGYRFSVITPDDIVILLYNDCIEKIRWKNFLHR